MPSRDTNGNTVYSQAEYEHFNFSGEPFSGFVEGIGYVMKEVEVTARPINKSGMYMMFDIRQVQYIFDMSDIIYNEEPTLSNRDGTETSNDNDSFTPEELRLALEKSQSYSFNQGNLPWLYKTVSRITSDYDNFAVNVFYGMANDWFQVAQVASFGALERDEWYNPFTGTRFGNLDGTPSYEPMSGFHTAILMGIPMASKSVGYVIPKGMFHIEDFKWGKGTVGKQLNKLANMLLGMINGQLAGARGVVKAKSLAPKIKEYEEKYRDKKIEKNE